MKTWWSRKRLQIAIMKRYRYNNRKLKRNVKQLIMTDDLTETTVMTLENDTLRFTSTFDIRVKN